MARKKQVAFVEWLDERGYAIFIVVQVDGSDGELILARAILEFDKDNNPIELLAYEEILQSSHRGRLLKRYELELKTNKQIIMDVRETLMGLSIEELESLLPSYYQLVIERRIAELKAQQVNEVTTTNGEGEGSTKVTDRGRVIS